MEKWSKPFEPFRIAGNLYYVGTADLAVSAGDSHARSGRAATPLRLGARGLAALYAGTPVGALRLSGLASGGSPDDDAALDAVFAATAYMVDDF